MNAIDIRGARFRYKRGDDDALKGIDLSVRPGERVAVIGLTGAGKTTLLRLLNRLIPESIRGEFSGEVSLFGQNTIGKKPADLSDLAGMVFQDFESQLFSTTAELDVAFGPENLGLPTAEIRERVDAALLAVGMEPFRRRDPSSLSGGQKQRLAIASVLSMRPRLLALDEPVTDLDPQGRAEIAGLAQTLSSSGGAVIMAEHEIELIRHADRIAGLARGEKIVDEDASKVLWDAPLLSSLGVRPPELVPIMQGLGLSEKPSSADEAAGIIKAKGIKLDPAKIPSEEITDHAAAIKIDSLTHSYPGGVDALKGVSLQIGAGDFVALLGRNGSGKTTLAKHLNGLLQPTSGAVEVGGRDTRSQKTAQLGRTVGFVFQDPDHQIFAERVFDEVAFAPRNHGFSEDDVKDRVKRALDLVGLGGFDERDPFALTKGERQRVALASILSADPETIVMDEPTTGLDYPAQKAVMDLLAALNREGRTVIVITHSIWVAAEYARRCVLLSGGSIVADASTRQVLTDPTLMKRAGLRATEAAQLGSLFAVRSLTASEFLAAAGRKI